MLQKRFPSGLLRPLAGEVFVEGLLHRFLGGLGEARLNGHRKWLGVYGWISASNVGKPWENHRFLMVTEWISPWKMVKNLDLNGFEPWKRLGKWDLTGKSCDLMVKNCDLTKKIERRVV